MGGFSALRDLLVAGETDNEVDALGESYEAGREVHSLLEDVVRHESYRKDPQQGSKEVENL